MQSVHTSYKGYVRNRLLTNYMIQLSTYLCTLYVSQSLVPIKGTPVVHQGVNIFQPNFRDPLLVPKTP